jgi:6-phosphogluconolactonase
MLKTIVDRNEFITTAASYITESACAANNRKDAFNIILAGGETPRSLYSYLRQIETCWKVWHVWFSDERCLNANDENLNSLMAEEALLSHVPIQASNIHRIKSELGAESAARLYQEEIKNTPVFDITLLGLGEDGHTASLFPKHDFGNEAQLPDVLSVFDAPKFPSERVTLSVQRLNRSRVVIFLVAGEKKRSIFEAYKSGAVMPATSIQGQEQTILLYCPTCII